MSLSLKWPCTGQEIVSDLSVGQLVALKSRKQAGPYMQTLLFLSGGSRLDVCAQPKNSLWLSRIHGISLGNGCAEQVMR